MKTVRFSLLNKKFDDQYTFDLQGYVSICKSRQVHLTKLVYIYSCRYKTFARHSAY
jgi:hypothetical protein